MQTKKLILQYSIADLSTTSFILVDNALMTTCKNPNTNSVLASLLKAIKRAGTAKAAPSVLLGKILEQKIQTSSTRLLNQATLSSSRLEMFLSHAAQSRAYAYQHCFFISSAQ